VLLPLILLLPLDVIPSLTTDAESDKGTLGTAMEAAGKQVEGGKP
jgi:hypothetical protein